jgi:hypothetical protein
MEEAAGLARSGIGSLVMETPVTPGPGEKEPCHLRAVADEVDLGAVPELMRGPRFHLRDPTAWKTPL